MTTSLDLATIAEMAAEVEAAPALYQPSNIWSELVRSQIEVLRHYGIETFKKTLNSRYGEEGVLAPQHRQYGALAQLLGSPKPAGTFTVAMEPAFKTDNEAMIYAAYACMLWDYRARLPSAGRTAPLQEPPAGSPRLITYQGQRISQDLARSAIEFDTITGGGTRFLRDATIAEIGPAYGRLAYVFAEATNARYIFFDIPPALYVAQWYFTALYGPGAVAPFRRHRTAADALAHLAGKRFGFFTPNQLELFPDHSFDVMVNIDSFGEMTSESVTHYFRQMQRLSRSLVYLRNLRDIAGSVLPLSEAPWKVAGDTALTLEPGWARTLDRLWDFDEMYYERLYERRS